MRSRLRAREAMPESDGKVREHSPTDGVVNWYLDQDTNPDANGWTRHSVAYKTKASIPEVIQNLLFRTFNSYVEICQPKFEECIMPTEWMRNENDAKMTFSRNPAGTWVPGRVYYYFDGIQDWVYARRGENDATKIVYVMRKRTTALGYPSNTEPYLDPVHWEPSSYQRFVCAESMFSEEIYTDKITAKKVRAVNGDYEALMNPNDDFPLQIGLQDSPLFKVSKTGAVFGSYVKHNIVHITTENWRNYCRTDIQLYDNIVAWDKCGDFIVLEPGTDVMFEVLPVLGTYLGTRYNEAQKMDIRAYIGMRICVYNRCGHSVGITYKISADGNSSFSTTLYNGMFGVFRCVLGKSGLDEFIYWDHESDGNIV